MTNKQSIATNKLNLLDDEGVDDDDDDDDDDAGD